MTERRNLIAEPAKLANGESAAKHLDAAVIAARLTIELTSHQTLVDLVRALAEERGVSPGHLAANLVAKALELFREVTETISPAKVIADWAALADAHSGADTSWSFVTHRPMVIKIRLTACEFEQTTSSMANLLLAKGLEHQLVQGGNHA